MPAPDAYESALKSLLVGPPAGGRVPTCTVVNAVSLMPSDLDRLAEAAAHLSPGDVAAYAIAIEGSVVSRLVTLVTLGVRIARAQTVLRRAGAVRVHRYAVFPTLQRPTIAYEMGTPAAAYADRHLRPGGGGSFLRSAIARIAGVDPSIGAVVVAGLKA